MRKPSLRRNRRHFPLCDTRQSGALVVAVALVAVLVAACGSSSTKSSAAAQVSAEHPVTLVVLNGDGGETGLLAAYAALNKKFEAAHPGVTIKFEVKSFNDLLSTLKLQLSGSSGVPDVTQSNQGYSSLGALVTDGLVKNLDSIASTDDWSARQPASLLALDGKFSNDGKRIGFGFALGNFRHRDLGRVVGKHGHRQATRDQQPSHNAEPAGAGHGDGEGPRNRGDDDGNKRRFRAPVDDL